MHFGTETTGLYSDGGLILSSFYRETLTDLIRFLLILENRAVTNLPVGEVRVFELSHQGRVVHYHDWHCLQLSYPTYNTILLEHTRL